MDCPEGFFPEVTGVNPWGGVHITRYLLLSWEVGAEEHRLTVNDGTSRKLVERLTESFFDRDASNRQSSSRSFNELLLASIQYDVDDTLRVGVLREKDCVGRLKRLNRLCAKELLMRIPRDVHAGSTIGEVHESRAIDAGYVAAGDFRRGRAASPIVGVSDEQLRVAKNQPTPLGRWEDLQFVQGAGGGMDQPHVRSIQ